MHSGPPACRWYILLVSRLEMGSQGNKSKTTAACTGNDFREDTWSHGHIDQDKTGHSQNKMLKHSQAHRVHSKVTF